MMEYAPGGELFVRLAEVGRYSEQEAKPIFAQIASAVEYMVSTGCLNTYIKVLTCYSSKTENLAKVITVCITTRYLWCFSVC